MRPESWGVDVPTLCYVDGYEASTSCLVCMVKVRGTGRLAPACGTRAEDGMEIESETDDVRQVRRMALELLLSDHVGDCLAPCHFTCPAHMDILRNAPANLGRKAPRRDRDRQGIDRAAGGFWGGSVRNRAKKAAAETPPTARWRFAN